MSYSRIQGSASLQLIDLESSSLSWSHLDDADDADDADADDDAAAAAAAADDDDDDDDGEEESDNLKRVNSLHLVQ